MERFDMANETRSIGSLYNCCSFLPEEISTAPEYSLYQVRRQVILHGRVFVWHGRFDRTRNHRLPKALVVMVSRLARRSQSY